MRRLEDVGILGIKPIKRKGVEIMPIESLKTLLPDLVSPGEKMKGYTNTGCVTRGVKDGKSKQVYAYNVCNHEECFREVPPQTVSYTIGTPAMISAKFVAHGVRSGVGVENMEEFDAKPFMDKLNS